MATIPSSSGQLGIENRAFNATITAGITGGVAALGGGVVAVIELFQADTPAATVVAALAVVAVGLIAIAIVVSADIRARAGVEIAALQFAPRASTPTASVASSLSGETNGDGVTTPECCPVVATTGARMGVSVGGEICTVLALRIDPRTEATRFLVARPHSLPRWLAREELDESLFAFDAQGFPVRE